MKDKMLELAEKITPHSPQLASDIRSIFTPRDWREGCVVCRSIYNDTPSWWGVYSPDGKYALYPEGWIENEGGVIGNNSGFYAKSSEENERDARAALASCPTPYPGYKENTCGKPSSSSTSTSASPSSFPSGSPQSSGGSPSLVLTNGVSSPSGPPSSSSSGTSASTTHSGTSTLTFGGPALRVAFHFDGDRLVRWEILEQREELRGKSRLSGCVFSEVYPIIMSCGTTCIHGAIRTLDHNYKIEGTHTRATITALGREIDQVNREWCEKLGIKQEPDATATGKVFSDDYTKGFEDARKWYGAEFATFVKERVMLTADRDSLRRQLDAAEKQIAAAEKVIEICIDSDIPRDVGKTKWTLYRAVYPPKNGGAA